VAVDVRRGWFETGWSDDRDQLAAFVGSVWEILEAEFGYPSLLVPQDDADRLLAFLADLRPAVLATQNALRTPAWISDLELDRAGLVGPQLAFKLNVYHAAETDYLDERQILLAQAAPPAPEQKRGLHQRIKGWFKPANTLIGTVAAIFPPAEGLKEGKEMAEAVVERANRE